MSGNVNSGFGIVLLRLYSKRNAGYGTLSKAEYSLTLSHSRLRSPAFHPNYKRKKVGWGGSSYWLATLCC